MNSVQIAQAVDALARAGAAVVLQLPGAYGGGETIRILPIEAGDLVEDPRAFIAGKLGVTVEQLDEWEEHEHIPKCAGYTKAGPQCAKAVSPHTMVEPAEFAALHRVDYCHIHR